jgi:hypothetical protein
MHEKEDKSIKDINDMAKSAIERQRFRKW